MLLLSHASNDMTRRSKSVYINKSLNNKKKLYQNRITILITSASNVILFKFHSSDECGLILLTNLPVYFPGDAEYVEENVSPC